MFPFFAFILWRLSSSDVIENKISVITWVRPFHWLSHHLSIVILSYSVYSLCIVIYRWCHHGDHFLWPGCHWYYADKVSLVLCRHGVTGIMQVKCHWYYADKVSMVLCRQNVTCIMQTRCQWYYADKVSLVLCKCRQSVTGSMQTKCHWYYADKVSLVLRRQSVTGIMQTRCCWYYADKVSLVLPWQNVTGIIQSPSACLTVILMSQGSKRHLQLLSSLGQIMSLS